MQGVLDTTLCDQVCQWLSPVSSTNKTDRHDIIEILLKVALNTINPNLIFVMYVATMNINIYNYRLSYHPLF